MSKLEKAIKYLRDNAYEGEYESEADLLASAQDMVADELAEEESDRTQWFSEQPWLLEQNDTPSIPVYGH